MRFWLIFLLFIFPMIATAEDWPVWRGSSGDGFSKETGILKSWPARGIKELWRIPLGEGYSSISIVNDIAYTAFGDSKYEYCIAIEAKTGKIKWKKRIGYLFRSGIGDGPRATPTWDAGKIYIVSGHGDLWCLEAENGNKVWNYNLLKKFMVHANSWGVCSSVYVYKNMLLYNPGGKAGIVALDKKTGKEIWRATKDQAAYSTPLVTDICGEKQAVFFTHEGAVALNPETGSVLWQYPWRSSNIATTPICYQDHIFISSAYGVGGAVIKISKNKDAYQVEQIWKHTKIQNHYVSSLLHKGYIYGFHNSILVCVDFKTGKRKWKKRGFAKGLIVGIEGHAIILGQRGGLALMQLNPEKYIEKGRSYPFPETNCLAVPVISNGRLFVRDNRELVCLDIMGRSE